MWSLVFSTINQVLFVCLFLLLSLLFLNFINHPRYHFFWRTSSQRAGMREKVIAVFSLPGVRQGGLLVPLSYIWKAFGSTQKTPVICSESLQCTSLTYNFLTFDSFSLTRRQEKKTNYIFRAVIPGCTLFRLCINILWIKKLRDLHYFDNVLLLRKLQTGNSWWLKKWSYNLHTNSTDCLNTRVMASSANKIIFKLI